MWHCCQVLINQCASWLLHGLLVDPYHEFFIQKNVDPICKRKADRQEAGRKEAGRKQEGQFVERERGGGKIEDRR